MNQVATPGVPTRKATVTGIRTAGAIVAVGAVMVAGAALGPLVLGVAVFLLQVGTSSGWHQLLRVPGARGGSLVALAAGLASLLVLEIDVGMDVTHDVGRLAPVIGLAVLGCFVHQILRGPPREQLVASLTATSSLVVALALSALWIAVRRGPDGLEIALVGAVAATVAAAAAAIVPRGGWPVSVLAGTGAGLVTGAASGLLDLGVAQIVLLSVAAAGPAVVAGYVREATGRVARTAPATLAALPCVLAALPLWVLARVFTG
jgi:hypothetical protein